SDDSAEEATVSDAAFEAAALRLAERRHLFMDKVAEPLRPYIASLSPLIEGEVTVAAMPWGLTVR
ncbi:MAG TPA: hypothetical protein VHU80_08775, partial [Polyangiaceae bacterium]|nr:hypothetical protein [Polyangiaceae bacterium]